MGTGDDNEALRRLESMSARTWEMLGDLREHIAEVSARVSVSEAPAVPSPCFLSLHELLHEVGADIGRRHGEAIARGEHGARDVWQVALTAFGHLQECIGTALQNTPGADASLAREVSRNFTFKNAAGVDVERIVERIQRAAAGLDSLDPPDE